MSVDMADILRTKRQDESELVDAAIDRLEQQTKAGARTEQAKALAAESEQLAHDYGKRIRLTADTTDELKTLQDTLDIAEERIRAMQEDEGLSRLHPSRREEFISEILSDRIDKHGERAMAERAEEIRAEATEQVDALFEQDTASVELDYHRRGGGSFVSATVYDTDRDRDAIVAVEGAGTDFSMLDAHHSLDVVVPAETTVHVTSPAGEETQTLARGAYSIDHRAFGELAEESGLIEREERDAACQSSDKEALDIVVGRGETDTAHVIELRSGNGGYSSRNTKGWTNYRDFDAEREMCLIQVGQASYYNGGRRGKSERTWLVGRDEAQIWAQQVQNTNETIEEALDYMTPAEVQRLEEEGREVVRQGDVFFVEMVRSSNYEAIEDTRHEVSESDEGVTISHPEHTDLALDGRWKAVANLDASRPRGRRSRNVRTRD